MDPDIKDIVSKCLDSPGYILFTAALSSKRDAQGRPLIDFQYRRYHFALEDGRQAAAALKGFVEKEIQELIQQYEGGEDAGAKN